MKITAMQTGSVLGDLMEALAPAQNAAPAEGGAFGAVLEEATQVLQANVPKEVPATPATAAVKQEVPVLAGEVAPVVLEPVPTMALQEVPAETVLPEVAVAVAEVPVQENNVEMPVGKTVAHAEAEVPLPRMAKAHDIPKQQEEVLPAEVEPVAGEVLPVVGHAGAKKAETVQVRAESEAEEDAPRAETGKPEEHADLRQAFVAPQAVAAVVVPVEVAAPETAGEEAAPAVNGSADRAAAAYASLQKVAQRNAANTEAPVVEQPVTAGHEVKADVAKPEAVKAEVVKPETVKAEVMKPETARAEVVKPQTVQAEVVQPKSVVAEELRREVVQVEVKPEADSLPSRFQVTQGVAGYREQTFSGLVRKVEVPQAEVTQAPATTTSEASAKVAVVATEAEAAPAAATSRPEAELREPQKTVVAGGQPTLRQEAAASRPEQVKPEAVEGETVATPMVEVAVRPKTAAANTGGSHQHFAAGDDKPKQAETLRQPEEVRLQTPFQVAQPVQNQEPVEVAAKPVHESILSQVREKLETEMPQKSGEVTVRLNPEELGELTISVKMDGRSVKVEVTAETATAKQALMENIDRLKETFAKQNLTMEQFDVSTGSGGRFQQAQREGRSPYAGGGWFGGYSPKQETPVIEQQKVAAYYKPRENSLIDVRF